MGGWIAVAAFAASILVSAQDQFLDSNGVRLHYRDAGSGDPIVLIHGLGNSLETAWVQTGVLAALAKNRRVIAFDSRGHGASGKPSDPAAYGLEMVRDVVRLLDHLRVRRAHLVGYSQGAAIAGKALVTAPERFITSSFVGAPARTSWGEADDRMAATQVAQFTETPPFRSQLLRSIQAGQPAPTEAELQEQSQRLLGGNDATALAAMARGTGPTLVVSSRDIEATQVPVLCLIGSADPSVPAMSTFAQSIRSAKMVTIEGANHAGPKGVLTREEFIGHLTTFLASGQR